MDALSWPKSPFRIIDFFSLKLLLLSLVTMPQLIYKIIPRDMWKRAEIARHFEGAPVDFADGYIHFSTAEQVVETAEKHFAGQVNLLLVAFDAHMFGDDLKWETSRGGALFPHLYAALDPDDAVATWDLPLNEAGQHLFPPSVLAARGLTS